MYILITDETNQQPGEKERFFIYGGIFFPVENLVPLHDLVERARHRAVYFPRDQFKFDTRSRPSRITRERHTEAKRMVLEGCHALGVRFLAQLVLHDIASKNTPERLVTWGANTVLGAFHRFLDQEGAHGLCVMDRLPFTGSYRYLKDKFEVGLQFPSGGARVLRDRIGLFGFSCSGASHATSAADIILGSFRYCVNERDRDDVCRTMWPHIAKMTWHARVGDRIVLHEHGLLFRPQQVKAELYQAEYDGLTTHLEGLLKQD